MKFDSKFEEKIYNILLLNFKEEDILRQKRYFNDLPYTCDFYIPTKKLWIECSSYSKKKKKYHKKISLKKYWVEEKIKENFIFLDNLDEEKINLLIK